MPSDRIPIVHPYCAHVFEGRLTERELRRLKREIKRVIDPDHDSVRIYRLDSAGFAAKYDIGQVMQPRQNI